MKIPKVLIVEDEKNVREHLQTLLEKIDLQVITAADGEEGMAKVDDVDLILLNLVLPKKPGLEILHDLRKANNYVPVIVVTGDAAKRKEAEQFEIVDFIEKPYHPRELVDKVLRALRIKRNLEDISEATKKLKSFVTRHG